MKKHIIFTGSECTGKTLFAKMIFSRNTTAILDGRNFDIINDHFLFDLCYAKFHYQTIIVDDLKKDFDYEVLYSRIFEDEMIINRKFDHPETIKTPLFVFITNFPENLPVGSCFRNRFDVINFDTHPISELMYVIKQREITVNAPC